MGAGVADIVLMCKAVKRRKNARLDALGGADERGTRRVA